MTDPAELKRITEQTDALSKHLERIRDAVPCIGWLADPPCPVHQITHGCRWPEGHTGGRHECICGATARRQVERVSVLDQRGRSVK